MAKPLGLYIHVPFCVSKCGYCDFYSVKADEGRMDRYLAAVGEHLREYGEITTGYRVDTVYLGGGTPSVLGPKRLTRLLGEIRKSFSLTHQVEITVECNPESMTQGLLRALRRADVNRLSVGVQSAKNDELRRLGRAHTWEQARDAILLAKKLGFDNLSVDLIYGQPEQTMDSLMASLDAVLALEPAHLSCYALQLERSTPMGQAKPPLPDDDTVADMYDMLCMRLRDAGFSHYEISNWARGGLRSRHNCKYWDLSDYLGLGPGAHSYMQGRRFAFIRDVDAYCAGMAQDGGQIVADEDDVATMHRHGEYLMLRLRTADGVRESEFHRLFEMSFARYAAKLQPLIARGLAACEAGRWYLTERGMFVSNSIIADVLSADDPAPGGPAESK